MLTWPGELLAHHQHDGCRRRFAAPARCGKLSVVALVRLLQLPRSPPTRVRAFRFLFARPDSCSRVQILARALATTAQTEKGPRSHEAPAGLTRARSPTTGRPNASPQPLPSLMKAQSIDLRRASDPRSERVTDRLGRSTLIDPTSAETPECEWLYYSGSGLTRCVYFLLGRVSCRGR